MPQTYVIAEAGVNHNGDADLALALVDAAAAAGADAVKFQTFSARRLVTSDAPMAAYQERSTGRAESQLAMLARLELDQDAHLKLHVRAGDRGVDFLSTAFDAESLSFLVEQVGVGRLKIASGEITNAPLLIRHATTGLDMIVSTGMATLGEVEAALGAIAYGWSERSRENPGPGDFEAAYLRLDLRQRLYEKVTLLHCTSQYPTPAEDVNLCAMDTLRTAFGTSVGYSDHTQGVAVAIAAAARGAVIVEKHFTLDRTMEGPDHVASLEPREFAEMVEGIRTVDVALGDGVKAPRRSELAVRADARKSVVAAADIRGGDAFTEENLRVMRPGTGRPPADYWSLLGRSARRDYVVGDLIDD